MTDRSREAEPAAVPVRAKQAGEIQARWPWVEPYVWTERMLTALEKGVKGGKAKRLLCRIRAVLPNHSPCNGLSVLLEVNH